jgi:hypothetical protein
VAAAYGTACIAAFVWFYPIWSALPVPAGDLAGARWFWLESWR